MALGLVGGGLLLRVAPRGFLNSTLVLTALQYIRAGTTVEVIVPRQQLRPQCGMPGPYVNQTMSVRRAGTRVYEYVKKAYPETTRGRWCY